MAEFTSVVIPAYQSDGVIGGCLDALSDQTVPPTEVLIVNSSADNGLRDLVARHPLRPALVESAERLLPHAARNLGLARAQGGILLNTDPDCRPDRGWIAAVLAGIENGHEVLGGGIGLATSASARTHAVHLTKFHRSLPGLPAGPHPSLPTANLAFTRRAWSDVGPFEEATFSGDTLFTWRARQKAYDPWFEPQAVVWHDEGALPHAFLAERLRRGADFARARSRFEGWSRAREVLQGLFWPAVTGKLVASAMLSCWRAGLRPGPLQMALLIAGQTAWVVGESHYALRGASRSERQFLHRR